MSTANPDLKSLDDPALALLLREAASRYQAILTVVTDRYRENLLALVQKKLSAELKKQYDPEDILQSVFRSFMQWVGDKNEQLSGHDCFGKLLNEFAKHKIIRKSRYEHAEKRNVSRTHTICENLITRPSDHDELEFVELLQKYSAGLDERERIVFKLLYNEQKSQAEIAQLIGCSPSTVSRIMDGIREKWECLTSEV